MSIESPEKVAPATWAFLMVVFFIMACIVGVMLCCCTGKFAVDASAIPHVIRDIEKVAAAS